MKSLRLAVSTGGSTAAGLGLYNLSQSDSLTSSPVRRDDRNIIVQREIPCLSQFVSKFEIRTRDSKSGESKQSQQETDVIIEHDPSQTTSPGHLEILRDIPTNRTNYPPDETRSQNNTIVDSYLNDNVRDHFRQHPITSREFNSAFSVFENNPEAIQEILPVGYTEDFGFDSLQDKVRRLLSHGNLLESASRNVASVHAPPISNYQNPTEYTIENEFPELSSDYSHQEEDFVFINETKHSHSKKSNNKLSSSSTYHNSTINTTEEWTKLRLHNRTCLICQDILAKPETTSCGHSFCGICLENHFNSLTSQDTEISHCCPSCRNEIKHRSLCIPWSEEIFNLVQTVPDCMEKREWQSRCDEYEAIKHKREFDEEHNKKGKKNDESSDDWNFQDYVIVAVAVFILMAIVKGRTTLFRA
eukprot:gene9796-20384_t